jgi:response regulator RpfG family c-di-GMP phosphodiesterase/tRNA A-37 threonylcarbamoyl transferase component Bud32
MAPPPRPGLLPRVQAFFDRVGELRLVPPATAREFIQARRDQLERFASPTALGAALVEGGLLTAYQADRVLSGMVHGLVLGNYQVIDRLGAGGMAVVFLAEHAVLKRRAAVKVLPVDENCPPELLDRFYAEMRVLAELHHPNIVLALDAGEVPAPGPNMPRLVYLAMELIEGGDLEEYVLGHGRVPIARACDWIRQAACGLQEAHDRHLIHRDVKPSNLLLSTRGDVKVVDFGLARQFCSSQTDPRALLGSIEFMAPEQSHDPSGVGAAADIYGLGATLFWLLTGEPPYPPTRVLSKALRALQEEPPRPLRALRPDAPPELEALVSRMVARDPAQRPALPLTVMNALAPFAVPERTPVRAEPAGPVARGRADTPRPHVLIIDDQETLRRLCRATLELAGYHCSETGDGETALHLVHLERIDLVLLDLNLPGIDGYEVCRRLRERPPQPHLKVIVISGRGNQDQLAEALPRGADDYMSKPFAPRQLEAKVRHALELKEAQDRVDTLTRHLVQTNRQLEQSLQARAGDVRQAQDALLFGMARLAELRDGETAGHLRRMQRFARCLAEHASEMPPWNGLVDAFFLEQLERCVPLHDIGKTGLPDEVLLKPGALTPAERALVETHPVIGDRILETLGKEHGQSLAFLGVARAIVRHHHERHDGRGYPDRLAGDAIPAAARLTALADVYDTLRRQRQYKPARPHAEAVHLILHESPGQFDPLLLQAFAACQQHLERIYRDLSD